MKALPLFVAVLFVTAPIFGAVGATPTVDDTASDATRLSVGSTADVPTATAPSVPVTGPAQTASAQTAPAQTGNASNSNTTFDPNVLTIPRDEVDRSVIEEESVELSPALEFASHATSMRLETEAVAERIQSAESADRRQRFLLGELNRIEQQVITLGSVQRTAIQSYSAGQLSTREFLVRLAQVNARAKALDDRRERLSKLSDETTGFSFSSGRLASLERELDTFSGPVRSIALRTLRGDVDSTRFYVATGPQSVVLSTIAGDRYVREVYRGTLRERGTNGLSPEGAVNATAAKYPSIWQRKVDYTVFGAGDNYLVRVPYEGGQLSAFVDSGSGAVFKEFQFYDLNRSLATETVTDTKDGLRLTVSRSYPGSPLYVNLTDARTGRPIDTNVTIGPAENDSTLVGRTGDDGVLWTVTPDYRFTVFAIKGNSVVFVTVDPVQPATANESTAQVDAAPTVAPPTSVTPLPVDR